MPSWQAGTVLTGDIRAKNQSSVSFIILVFSAAKTDFPNWRSRRFRNKIRGVGRKWLLNRYGIRRWSWRVVQKHINRSHVNEQKKMHTARCGHKIRNSKTQNRSKMIIHGVCMHESNQVPLAHCLQHVPLSYTGIGSKYRYTG